MPPGQYAAAVSRETETSRLRVWRMGDGEALSGKALTMVWPSLTSMRSAVHSERSLPH